MLKRYDKHNQGLSQDLETRYMAILKSLSTLFFEGEHNIFEFQT